MSTLSPATLAPPTACLVDAPPLPLPPAAAPDDDAGFRAFAARLVATGVVSDPWIDGRPRFQARPVVIAAAERRALEGAAEEICAAYQSLALLCAADPDLVARTFHLTEFQRLMWRSSAPLWHVLARADVFVTDGGLRVCELNCDTPSGEAEAVLCSAIAAADRPTLDDPSAALGGRLCDALLAIAGQLDRAPGPLTVGLLYPTELSEDLSMIRIYRRWLVERGVRVVLGSPFNLSAVGDGVGLFGTRCDLFLRHYKTDWWSERRPSRRSESAPRDDAPLERELGLLLGGVEHGACAVVNPFGAVLLQNKRSMALLWEAIDRLDPRAQSAVRRFLPLTIRLESYPPSRLAEERERWVLKSDYGCEGAEVIVGAACTDAEWGEAIADAVPERWVAQERFRSLRDELGRETNFGVYLVGGRASGFLTRLSREATDCHAVTAPTLVEAT